MHKDWEIIRSENTWKVIRKTYLYYVVELLKRMMTDPPVCPHMTFEDGRHGVETRESRIRQLEYQIRMEQWRIIRNAYFHAWKQGHFLNLVETKIG